MDQTNLTNPYYLEKPFFSTYPAKINIILTASLASLLLYCLNLKPAEAIAPIWRRFVIFHSFLAILLQVFIAYFAYPVILLPYSAVHYNGILTDYGISQSFQNSLLIALVFINAGVIFPLFYLRTVYLLDNSFTFLKSKPALIIAYLWYYIFPVVAPFPVFYYISEDLRLYYFNKFHVVYPDLFQQEALFFPIKGDPKGDVPTSMIILVVSSYGLTVLIASLVMVQFIRKHRQQQRQSRISLKDFKLQKIFLVAATSYAVITVAVPLTRCFSMGERADIFDMAVFNGTALLPITLASGLFIFKPVRKGLFSLVWKPKPSTNVVSSGINRVN